MTFESTKGRYYLASGVSDSYKKEADRLLGVVLELNGETKNYKLLTSEKNRSLYRKLLSEKIHPEHSYLIIGNREQLKLVPSYITACSIFLYEPELNVHDVQGIAKYKLSEYYKHLSDKRNFNNIPKPLKDDDYNPDEEKFKDERKEVLILTRSANTIESDWFTRCLREELDNRDYDEKRTIVLSEAEFPVVENLVGFTTIRLNDGGIPSQNKTSALKADDFDE